MIIETPNLKYIQEMSARDTSFKKELISIIKDEFPKEKQIYCHNISNKNYKQASENVHKLKHKISILGLEKGYNIAVDYENNLLNNSEKGKDDFETILKLITQFLKTL